MALGNLTVRLGLDAAEYISGLSKAEAEAAKFVKQQERTSLAIDKQIAALRTQAQTVGFTSEQLKIYELRQKGASDAQLLATVNILKQNKAFAEAQQAISKAAATSKAQTDASAAIDKQVKALHDQVAVQGRSERQTKLYELTQQGATKAQLASADAALRQKAAYESARKFTSDLKVAVIALGAALVGAAVGGFILFEKLLGKAASFQDLAEKTGASAEALASFQSAATVTNTSMDTLANLSVKLTKGLAGTDEETKQAANAIKQLGLNVEDFKKLDPGAQFELIAKTLDKFEDGAGKTAFAVAAMGRAGADSLPFFKELAAQGQRNITLTAAQIKAADDYKDAQARLRAEIELFGQKLAIAAIGPLGDFKTALIETGKQVFGFGGKVTDLGTNTGIQDFVDKAARALAVLINALDLVTRGFQLTGIAIAGAAAQAEGVAEGRAKNLTSLLGPLQFIKNVIRGINQEAKEVIDRPLFTSNLEVARAARAAQDNSFESNFPPSSKPRLRVPDFGSGGRSGSNDAANKAAAEAKKILDKQLSDLDNFIKAEDRILQSRESALTRHYQNDQLSIASYFDARREALVLNTQATVAAYDKQIEALEDFAKRSKSATAQLEAQSKIGDVQEKRAAAQSKAAEEKARQDDEQIRAARAYADQVDELRAKVLELSNAEGDAAKAALIRFDIQNRALRQRATLEGDTGTLRNIGVLRQDVKSQTDINKLLQEAQLIEERLGTTETRLNLERNLGLRGELASLGELGKARAASLPDLQRIADRYREIAAVSGDERLIAAADRFNLKIKELAATTDVLADKFRNVFQDSFADAFANFIDGTTSAKDAFKAFADDVVRQINRMAAQEIASSLFGKGSGGSDSGILGGIIEAIVGAMAAGEKGGPVSGSTPYIVGERGPEIFVPRTVAAAATKQIDSLIAQKGKPAEYTDRVKAATVATNIPHLIGAKGPEIFVPKVDGIVIPNDKVNKLSRVLQGRANGGPVVSATPYIVGERGPEIFTPRNAATVGQSEKVVTRLVSSVQPKASQVAANLPRVVGARGPELFVPKAAGIIIPNDKVAKLARSFGNDRPKVPSYSPPGGTPRLAGQILAVGRSSQPTDFDLSSERSSLVAAVARRREISAPLARTILRDEKIITRYANAPYSRRASGGPVAAHVPYIVGERGSEIFIPKSASATVQRDAAISKLSKSFQKQGHSASVATAQATRIINEELVANAPRQRRADGGPVAASTPYVVGELGPELFMPKAAERIIKHEKAVDDLVSNKIQHRASSPVAANVSIEREIFISKLASTNIKNEKFITDLVSKTIQHRASVKNERVQNDLVSNTRNEKIINLVSNIQRGPFAAHQTYLINEREIPSAKVIADDKAASVRLRNVRGSHYGFLPALELGLTSAHTPLRSLNFTPRVAQQRSPVLERRQHQLAAAVSSVQRRAIGGPGAAHQNFVSKLRPELYVPQGGPTLSTDVDAVRSGAESRNSNWVKNEKVIYDLITNTIQHRAQSGPVQARQTYVVGERGPELLATKSAEKIIKNESRVSELVTNNARRNEKVINDLVSKTVHHRQNAVAAPDVAAKIIKNESRISELVSNDVQRNDEIINRLVTTTRREGGRSNQLLIVGANGPELFIPKAAGSIVKNERRINELVSNIEHHNIDRRNEKTIDEIISDTVQRRARGGPVGANQPYIVGERGPEWFVPKTSGTIISNGKAGGMTVQNTFVLPPGPVTRDTQIQIAASVSRSVGLANRRLN